MDVIGSTSTARPICRPERDPRFRLEPGLGLASRRRRRGPASEAGVPEWTAGAASQDQPAHERAVALDEAIKRTGGRREDLVTAATLAAKLRELAARLDNQYRVIYEGPPSLTQAGAGPAAADISRRHGDLICGLLTGEPGILGLSPKGAWRHPCMQFCRGK